MSNRQVARNATIVMIGIFISRVLGLVRERAVAQVFGRTLETDAYFAAFAIPDLMYYLLVGGALSAAFIPVFTSYLAKDDEETAWHVASTFITVTVLLLLAFTIFGEIFAAKLAPLVAYDYSGSQLALLVRLMRIVFPAVLFTALAGLEMGVLNSYQHFTAPAVGPILYNLGIILGAYALGPRMGIYGMALGLVAGAFSNFAIQLPTMLKFSRAYRPNLDLRHPGIRQIGILMFPAMIGLSVNQLNLMIGQNLASGLVEGSITALRLANRLMQFPLGVFAMGISTAIFPLLTRLAATEARGELKRTYSLGLRTVLIITIPAAVGLFVLGEPIVRLLFETGEFTPQDTQATAFALFFYALSLPALSGIQLTSKMFYALYEPQVPVKIGILSIVVNTGLSLIFLRWTGLEHGGLALASTVATTINFVVYLFLLRQRLGSIDGTRIGSSVLKSIVASLVMGLVVYGTSNWVGNWVSVGTARGKVLQVCLPMLVGVGVYGLFLLLFRMEELEFLLGALKRRRKQSAQGADQ